MSNIKKGLIFVSIVLVAVMILPGLSSAQNAPRGRMEAEEPPEYREMYREGEQIPDGVITDLDVGEHSFQLSVNGKKGDSSKQFDLAFMAEYGLGFRANYKENTHGMLNGFGFGMAFEDITEFRDTDGDGAFTENDEVVSVYPLHVLRENYNQTNGSMYTPLRTHFRQGVTEEGETTVNVIYTQTLDGVFAIKIYVTEKEVITENGTRMHPLELKMDFLITDYPYLANDTQLALNIYMLNKAPEIQERNREQWRHREQYEDLGEPGLGSEEDMRRDQETYDERLGMARNEEGIRMRNSEDEDRYGFFTWSEFVTVDGQEMRVISSVSNVTVGNQTVKQISLAYPRGDVIIHDPKVGVSAYTEFMDLGVVIGDGLSRVFPTGSLPIFMIGVASAGVIVAAAYVSRKDRKSPEGSSETMNDNEMTQEGTDQEQS